MKRDYTSVIIDGEEFKLSKPDKLSFSKFIREKRKEVEGVNGKKLSIAEHAQMLGLSSEMYRKIINQQKPNQSRDCIIAICVTLRLTTGETNEALHLYGLPKLDSCISRDFLISRLLDAKYPQTLDVINERLTAGKFEPLDIIEHRSKEKTNTAANIMQKAKYEVEKTKVETSMDAVFFGDQYNSFETEYDPQRYQCVARMWLVSCSDDSKYILSAEPTGNYAMQSLSHSNTSEQSFYKYNSPEESGEFAGYFLELKGRAMNELKNKQAILNDTKNFRERISANLRNNRIHIFYETFDFTIPELNEYLLLEYVDGLYRLSISHHSMFMREYLESTDYEAIYGKTDSMAFRHYDSIDEIERHLNNTRGDSQIILEHRAYMYKSLRPKVEACLEALRQRKEFIRNIDYIFDDHDRVCEFFHVLDAYECKTVDEFGDFIQAQKRTATFKLKNGESIDITLDDLYRAFELGFPPSIEYVCMIKSTQGSIDNVLM